MRHFDKQTFLILGSLCLLLASCARPILIVEATTADLELEADAFVDSTVDFEIGYDYWSPDGVPFVTLLNLTEDTLYLDLRRSTFKQRSYSVEFEDFLGIRGSSITSIDYPDLSFRRIEGNPMLILVPEKWASFYGPSCHDSKSMKRGDPFSFEYSYRKDSSIIELTHQFNLTGLERIKRKELSSYERQSAGPNLYYVDQEAYPSQNQAAWQVLDILLTVLFLL